MLGMVKFNDKIKVSGVGCQVSGVSPAAGRGKCQFDQKKKLKEFTAGLAKNAEKKYFMLSLRSSAVFTVKNYNKVFCLS